MLSHAHLSNRAAIVLVGANERLHAAQRMIVGRRGLSLAGIVNSQPRVLNGGRRRGCRRIVSRAIKSVGTLIDGRIASDPGRSIKLTCVLILPIVLVVERPRV